MATKKKTAKRANPAARKSGAAHDVPSFFRLNLEVGNLEVIHHGGGHASILPRREQRF